MKRRRNLFPLLLVLAFFSLISCAPKLPLTLTASPTENTRAAMKKPYLIMISLDGFRWDYVERFQPPNLSRFVAEGVQAESLVPSFPSKTFPNHYTLATGMYPENHGLVGNSFFSYKKNALYTISNRAYVEDGTFYNGTPIWVQAARYGMVTASYFFVGSEANIQGIHPTYYHPYDGEVQKSERVAGVLEWLRLPAKQRPHMITMYFEDMDNAGHAYGPNDDEKLKQALFDLDAALGSLFDGVRETGLPVNIIIVSDHGMLEIPMDQYMSLDLVSDDTRYRTVSNGAMVSIHPNRPHETEEIYVQLKDKEDHFTVYKTADTPMYEYEPKNKDWGTIQIIPEKGYYFITNGSLDYKKNASKEVYGEHGFDPGFKEMHGIFYGNGPAFNTGQTVPSVKNIHIYPVMCEILDIPVPEEVDGELNALQAVLKK
jgi:predicted AlkP superfamily pyrophosphatase or phosphodiesterase